mmetsp:Transcript_27511/g.64158  ORF Transcript_27511/g.64158 Transcript_27511/m.64158 type:complete len:167 (-) Transcript_27511:167-667(-)|eukprot:CAMPEP_0178400056 /NCGR_PEP_ID=MMETSP0689_2-20121128/15593_1 /TAXON_ID=160604 /ORGANISM="Amphidinium massartii, Strain CS-259" /LENGTH=166 /DNA_ID=CAMNT_0020020841 /DNA_START=84 /DNA_END=584 /DNA_ORIENTATION=+
MFRIQVLLPVVLAMQAAHLAAGTANVYGKELQHCSTNGTALTGFTRDGHCQDLGDDDAGSHHICITMRPDFCTVTGQPNWCVRQMPCMGQAGYCPIGNWCVCQWAFAAYLDRWMQQGGSCDSIVDVVCGATNFAAVKAYEASSDPSHRRALQCIRQHCPDASPVDL